MTLTRSSLVDANVTVTGHFNPAILRHDFLVRECGIDLGEPVRRTENAIPTFSEIQYSGIWWMMELNRMIVRDLKLEMKAATLLVTYLDKLPYTPLFAVGINVFGTFVSSGSPVKNYRLLNRDSVWEMLQPINASDIDLTIKSRIRGKASWFPAQIVLNFTNLDQSRVLLKVDLDEVNNSVHAHYNCEVRDLDIERSRLALITERYQTLTQEFSNLMEISLACCEDLEGMR
jgi:hypothetical protein